MSEPSDAERRRGPGRPPQPVNAAGSALDAFGAELRTLRGRRRWTLQALAELTGYSPQHLGAVERARVVPSEAVATACDMALLANGRLVTLLAGVIREQADARNRRQIVRRSRRSADNHGIGAPAGAPGTALGNEVDWDRLADAGHRSSQVTTDVADDLEQVTDLQRRLYHERASAEMLVHVRAHLGLLTALLDGPQTDRLRPRIAAAAAEAAGFAAWLWFDLGDLFRAQSLYRDASAAVGEAGDRGLGAYIRGYQGIIAARSEGPGHALTYLREASRMGRGSLSGTTSSW
ncbi:MAG: helix-turn-helix domain-containing protein, partial [Pseudonocardiales bacterium]|nr:helix-turn-helix domain-containing protein [Pseudonocardiales bacterium]